MNFLDFPCTILEISIPFALSRFSANFIVKILLVNLSCVTESCFFFFFFFVGESGNCLDEGEHERLCKENEASQSTLVILGLTDVREWRQSIKEEISIACQTPFCGAISDAIEIKTITSDIVIYAWRMQIFQWLLPVLVTPLMKGQAWNVCWGTQAKTGHFCSLFFGNSLTYFIKDAFDWPYSGIRIRKIFVANLLNKCTVILGQSNAAYIGISYFRQISDYCNTMKGKTSDF